MPFKSKAQMRFLYKYHPEIARKWRREHPGQNIRKLPERTGKDNKNG